MLVPKKEHLLSCNTTFRHTPSEHFLQNNSFTKHIKKDLFQNCPTITNFFYNWQHYIQYGYVTVPSWRYPLSNDHLISQRDIDISSAVFNYVIFLRDIGMTQKNSPRDIFTWYWYDSGKFNTWYFHVILVLTLANFITWYITWYRHKPRQIRLIRWNYHVIRSISVNFQYLKITSDQNVWNKSVSKPQVSNCYYCKLLVVCWLMKTLVIEYYHTFDSQN